MRLRVDLQIRPLVCKDPVLGISDAGLSKELHEIGYEWIPEEKLAFVFG